MAEQWGEAPCGGGGVWGTEGTGQWQAKKMKSWTEELGWRVQASLPRFPGRLSVRQAAQCLGREQAEWRQALNGQQSGGAETREGDQ